jgi:hypothetical protein
MKRWQVQLVLTIVLFIGVAIFGFLVHQRVVASGASPQVIEAKDDQIGARCGMLIGFGSAFIWLLPAVMKWGRIREK